MLARSGDRPKRQLIDGRVLRSNHDDRSSRSVPTGFHCEFSAKVHRFIDHWARISDQGLASRGLCKLDYSLPALYLLDGDHAFAMATDIVQYLIYGKHVPDLVIISPAYGSKLGPDEGGNNMRDRDFDMTPEGDQYLEFLRQELIPFAEANYRNAPTSRTLWGYSSSGYFALYVLFQRPDLFQKYIIVDGCDVEEHSQLETSYAAQHTDLPARLFMSAPPERDASPFFDALSSRNYPSLSTHYVQLNDIGHFAVSAEGLTKGLVAVFAE